jgi:hypothetical protein
MSCGWERESPQAKALTVGRYPAFVREAGRFVAF